MRLEDGSTVRGLRQRIAIDGQWHLVVDLTTLEGLAYDAPGSITYPYPGPGWATTRIGSARFAAWFGEAS